MMKGVMKSLAPHKVFEGKAESWKEWKEDLEEFWELHHQGTKEALRKMVSLKCSFKKTILRSEQIKRILKKKLRLNYS